MAPGGLRLAGRVALGRAGLSSAPAALVFCHQRQAYGCGARALAQEQSSRLQVSAEWGERCCCEWGAGGGLCVAERRACLA